MNYRGYAPSYPYPWLRKGGWILAQEAQVLGEQEYTITEGFEAGDPTNWTQLTPSRFPLKDMWNLDYVLLILSEDDSNDSDDPVSVRI